jgi:tripartite-type tricarboxylate transporter receptor subunit TctC
LPGFDRSTWHGLLAPAGTPREIIATLNALVVKIVNTQEVRDLFSRQGLEAQTNTPEQYATLIKKEIEQVTRLIRATGAKTE